MRALAPLSAFHRVLESFFDRQDRPKERVLVLGSGWGAHAFVGALDRRLYDVAVVSPTGQRFNQPSMIAAYPDPPLTTDFSPFIEQIEDIGIAIDQKTVRGQKATYSFDKLVIATGSEAFDFGVPGVQEHCLMCKTAEDMAKIRLADPKDAIVLGAGPTGIELACKLQSEGVHVRILEASPTILPGFSQQMRQAVKDYLDACELPVQTNMLVKAVTPTTITVPTTTIHHSATMIWTCGIRPTLFVRQLTGGKQLEVDSHLRWKENIYAVGDCVKGYPPTAQNAEQQGHWLAQHFNANFTSDPYQYKERGRVLDLTYVMFVEMSDRVWEIPYFLTPLARWALK